MRERNIARVVKTILGFMGTLKAPKSSLSLFYLPVPQCSDVDDLAIDFNFLRHFIPSSLGFNSLLLFMNTFYAVVDVSYCKLSRNDLFENLCLL